MDTMQDGFKVRGFARFALHNVRTGKTEMSDWIPNVITADGFQNYIVGPIGAVAGSKTVTHIAVATQTDAPTSGQTSASGEFGNREAATVTFSANGTLQATASWNTDEATQSNLGAVAMYNTSSAGTAGSIATFATSAKTTDQTLSVTYQWRFS